MQDSCLRTIAKYINPFGITFNMGKNKQKILRTNRPESLVTMGLLSFQVLYFSQEKTTTELATDLNTQTTTISEKKRELKEMGWLGEDNKPTEAGKYFIKTIYLNEKIRSKLK